MTIIKHSVSTKAKPEKVWELWSKVETWPKWDHGIEATQLVGSFKTGAKGWLKPKGGPKVKFELLDVQENKKFHDRSYLPFARLDFIHTLETNGNETIVTHDVQMTGLLTFLFSKVIGAGIKKDMPSTMERLVRVAEQN